MVMDETSGFNDLTGEYDNDDPADAFQVAQAAARDVRILLNIVAALATVATLYFAKEVLLPITLAVMLSFVLTPVVQVLQRLRFPRAASAVLAVFAAIGLIGTVGAMIGRDAASFSSDAPGYAKTIEDKVQGIQGYAVLKLASITRAFHTNSKQPTANSSVTETKNPGSARRSPLTNAQGRPQPLPVEVVPPELNPSEIASKVLTPVIGPLETTFIVLIVAIFILIRREDLRDRLIRLFGSKDLHRTTLALDDAGQRLSRYFLSQLAVNTCFATIIGLGLWAIGIPSPAMWAIVAGLLRFVPYIGSLLAAVVPMVLAAAISPGWSMTALVAALYIGVDLIMGYVVEPLLYGQTTGLSPISVIVAALFWTWLWGPIGLIISTPLTLCFVVLGRHVKSLELLDVVLGDRPALSRVETFYHRILANNSDEALLQAEQMLGEVTLAEYYDEVVVPSLRLAAADEARGAIDRPNALKLRRLMLTFLQDIATVRSDANGAPRFDDAHIAAARILCVAGRGPFDSAVATMLAQLLAGPDGFPRVVSYNMIVRPPVASLNLSDFDIIAIVGLNISGAKEALRHLIRQLRSRAPDSTLLVGLAEEGTNAPVSGALKTICADSYCTTMMQAVEVIAKWSAGDRSTVSHDPSRDGYTVGCDNAEN
jgi:predicted PurR-regulated permease PerM